MSPRKMVVRVNLGDLYEHRSRPCHQRWKGGPTTTTIEVEGEPRRALVVPSFPMNVESISQDPEDGNVVVLTGTTV